MPPSRRRTSVVGSFDQGLFYALEEPLMVRLETRDGAASIPQLLEPGSLSNTNVPGDGYSHADVMELEANLSEEFGPGKYYFSVVDPNGKQHNWLSAAPDLGNYQGRDYDQSPVPTQNYSRTRSQSMRRPSRPRYEDDYYEDPRMWRMFRRHSMDPYYSMGGYGMGYGMNPQQQQQPSKENSELAELKMRMSEERIERAAERREEAQRKVMEDLQRQHRDEIRALKEQMQAQTHNNTPPQKSAADLLLEALPIVVPLVLNKNSNPKEDLLQAEIRDLKASLEKQREQAAIESLANKFDLELKAVRDHLSQNGDAKNSELFRALLETSRAASAEQLAAMSKGQMTPAELLTMIMSLQSANKPTQEPLEMMVQLMDIMERMGGGNSPLADTMASLSAMIGEGFKAKSAVEVAKAQSHHGGGSTSHPNQAALNGAPEGAVQVGPANIVEAQIAHLMRKMQAGAAEYETTNPSWMDTPKNVDPPSSPGLDPWEAAENMLQAANRLNSLRNGLGEMGRTLMHLFDNQEWNDLVDALLPNVSDIYKATVVGHIEMLINGGESEESDNADEESSTEG